eukprot:m.311507 g.311507  ORF g.311507 m.311507 type:complete len:331 (+) comp74733_c0_seq1:30-1022(+)
MGYRFTRSLIVLLSICIIAPFFYLQFLSPSCLKPSEVCKQCQSSSSSSLTRESALKKRKHYLLLIVVITGLNQAAERTAIRQTWLSNIQNHSILCKFVMGTAGVSQDQKASVLRENSQFNDLVFFDDFTEGYKKLAEKMLYTFSWASESVNFDYLFKADDDTFIRIPLLIDELRRRETPRRFYWGFFDGRASVKKTGKWKESEWFLCDRYLPFALGGGYVITSDLVDFIARNRAMLRVYSNEDVSLGSWLAPLDIERRHDRRFDTEYKSRGCHNAFIVTHKQSVEDMRMKQKELEDRGKLCSKEFIVRPSYEYNWNAPPSQCCPRNLPLP